jgi:hypothetical protein
MSPLLDDCILERLHKKRIFTVLDILEESPEKLIEITRLPFKVGIIKSKQTLSDAYSGTLLHIDDYDI